MRSIGHQFDQLLRHTAFGELRLNWTAPCLFVIPPFDAFAKFRAGHLKAGLQTRCAKLAASTWRSPARLVLLALLLVNGVTQGQEKYVTRFENHTRVRYSPQVRYVEKTVVRKSWNPFRKSLTKEKKLVPVVSWKPVSRQEVVPVTQRIAIKNPRRIAQKDERQSGGVKSIDGKPTLNFQTPSIVDSVPPDRRYGGVQRLDQDAPRYGMKLHQLR